MRHSNPLLAQTATNGIAFRQRVEIWLGETLPRISEQLADQALVEQVQKGDRKAFNLLVVCHQHKVASLVSRYTPSGDVPDVIQEAFIKAYRALDSFRGDNAFYT